MNKKRKANKYRERALRKEIRKKKQNEESEKKKLNEIKKKKLNEIKKKKLINRENEKCKKRYIRYRKNIILYRVKNSKTGGLADRLKNIIHCKLLAKLLNKSFYIIWKKEDIRKYINYEGYNFDKLNIDTGKVNVFETYNFSNLLKEFLIKKKNIDIGKVKTIISRKVREIYSLLGNKNYQEDQLTEYKGIYKKWFLPTEYLKLETKKILKNKENIVGIQIRTGDKFLMGGKKSKSLENKLSIYLKGIKEKCDTMYRKYNIFITSDYKNIYNLGIKIWGKDMVIYNDSELVHIDKGKGDLSKVFIDNYILSQKTVCLFISPFLNLIDYRNIYKSRVKNGQKMYKISGYSRLAALSCNHDNIYDIFLKKFEKIKLLKLH